MSKSAAEFSWPARVYWEDTDGGGVVYHANYLKFLERARTEWLRAKGFEQRALMLGTSMVFAVYSMQIQFLKPARLDDALRISARLGVCRRASFAMTQVISHERDGTELCRAEVEIACLDAETFRPIPIPAQVLTEIQR
ncbi:MAG: tol-pal system-associated acyl-CoA thioesterase [Lysobacterales bacterium]|nr:tol-pal system-associated acyl-CoA thioesterase [Xanthomonadales bacterium]